MMGTYLDRHTCAWNLAPLPAPSVCDGKHSSFSVEKQKNRTYKGGFSLSFSLWPLICESLQYYVQRFAICRKKYLMSMTFAKNENTTQKCIKIIFLRRVIQFIAFTFYHEHTRTQNPKNFVNNLASDHGRHVPSRQVKYILKHIMSNQYNVKVH